MIRLSIHPKPFDSKQYGIYLNPLKDNCPSPWQGAAIKLPKTEISDEIFLYEKRSTLEKVGAKIVSDKDGKGCFYEFPQETPYDFSKSLHANLLEMPSLNNKY